MLDQSYEAVVAQPTGEALVGTTLAGLAGSIRASLHSRRFEPCEIRLAHKLGSIIRAQVARRATLANWRRWSSTLVNSSITARHFNLWPLAQASNTKS